MSEEKILKSKLKVSAILFSYNVPIEEAKIIGTFIEELQQENTQLKEDIKFCLHSIKQEMEMSTDSRTRKEMDTCYEILKRWNK